MKRTRGIAITALAAALLAAPAPVAGDSHGSVSTALAEQDQQRVHWQGVYRASQVRIRRAEKELEKAEAVWRRGRRNNRLRGEPRVEAQKAIESARVELDAARRANEDLHEQARREGVPPGWFRDVELDG